MNQVVDRTHAELSQQEEPVPGQDAAENVQVRDRGSLLCL